MSAESIHSRRGVKRSYVSPYRSQLAMQTRTTILAAAVELFSERGYAATSVDDIAERAGLSRATVFAAAGSKRDLIKEARDLALAGDDAPIPMPERPWVQALHDEPSIGSAIAIYARAMREIYQRAARLELALVAAAEADSELVPLARAALEQRHSGCALVARALGRKGAFRPGVTQAAAADILFATASPDVYRLLVLVRRWSPKRYERWLSQSLFVQLTTSTSSASLPVTSSGESSSRTRGARTSS